VVEAIAVSHAAHDLALVASLIGRDARGPESDRAARLVESCPDCAGIHADLALIAAVTQSLPAVRSSRDFRLTPEDAERLRPTPWRRLLDAFGSSRDTLSRPLAIGLSTLGLAGFMIATVPTFSAGSAAGGQPHISPMAERIAPAGAAPAASDEPADGGMRTHVGEGPGPSEPMLEPTVGPSPLVIMSAGLFGSGIALGVARIAVRRARGNHARFEVV
jgi:hypothetical protein